MSTTKSLAENPDYVALQSALSLLQTQRDTAKQHILHLSQLKQTFLEEPELFLDQLKARQLDIPQAQKIVKCPRIDWQSYKPQGQLKNVIDQGVVDNVVIKASINTLLIQEHYSIFKRRYY